MAVDENHRRMGTYLLTAVWTDRVRRSRWALVTTHGCPFRRRCHRIRTRDSPYSAVASGTHPPIAGDTLLLGRDFGVPGGDAPPSPSVDGGVRGLVSLRRYARRSTVICAVFRTTARSSWTSTTVRCAFSRNRSALSCSARASAMRCCVVLIANLLGRFIEPQSPLGDQHTALRPCRWRHKSRRESYSIVDDWEYPGRPLAPRCSDVTHGTPS